MGRGEVPGGLQHVRTARRSSALVAILAVLAAVLVIASPAGAQPPRLSVGALTTEHMTNPLGISDSAPRFGWINQALDNGASQTAYEIRVSSSDSLDGDVWSTGRVASAASFDVEYAGPPLRSRTRYWWAVRVWDQSNTASEWSAPTWFETAFLDASEFEGDWIGRRATRAETESPEPLLRKDFSLADQRITSARAYIAGLGYYKLYLNGARVGDHELDPAYTPFNKRVMYVTYDVTKLLRRGSANAIGVSLGRGYYAPYNEGDVGNAAPWMGPSTEPKLKLQLDVTYADGTSDRIVSDTTWKAADGPTLLNEVKRGETYDARLEQPGWNAPGFDDSGWDAAVEAVPPSGMLVPQDVEPIRVTGELPPPVVTRQSDTVTLYDFRTTRAGWATVRLEGPAGATVTMVYGERLLGPDNTLGTSGQTYTYTLRGDGVETFTPSYSYNGYRYLRITKPESVTVRSVVGKTVGTDVPSTGGFTSSDPLLNRYHAAQRASLLSNLHSIPTDTPMYEKRGWTADAHLNADAALLNFGMENFYEKWMVDHRDNQAPDGGIGIWVPGYPINGNDPVWSASYVLINWDLYMYRGDVRTLEANYDGMKAWMDKWMRVFAGTGYVHTGFTFGDWGTPNPADPSLFGVHGVNNRIVGTGYVYEAARTLAEIARLLDKPADAAQTDAFADTVKSAFNATYFDPQRHAYYYDAKPPDFRQTEQLVPLEFGLVPDSERQAVIDNLLYDADVTRDDHLSTGAIGTKFLLPWLTEGGDPELAYRVATNPTYPGWGYWFQTVHGSNLGSNDNIVDTMWEFWPATSRSHNHAFLGTIDEWLFGYIAGIKPTAPAYREVQIKPYIVGGLTDASAHVTTPLGRVSSSWKRSGDALQLDVHIPVGAKAKVLFPTSDGYDTFAVGSGDYTFHSVLDQ